MKYSLISTPLFNLIGMINGGDDPSEILEHLDDGCRVHLSDPSKAVFHERLSELLGLVADAKLALANDDVKKMGSLMLEIGYRYVILEHRQSFEAGGTLIRSHYLREHAKKAKSKTKESILKDFLEGLPDYERSRSTHYLAQIHETNINKVLVENGFKAYSADSDNLRKTLKKVKRKIDEGL